MVMEGTVHRPNVSDEYLTPEHCWILETWNHPSDPTLSLAQARVQPGVTTQLHSLTGVSERYLIHAGEGRMYLGTSTPQDVQPGDVVHIPAGVAQKITNTGQNDLVFTCICTPPFTPDCYVNLEA